MKNRLIGLWDVISSSLAFVSSLLIFASIGLAVATLSLDEYLVNKGVTLDHWLFHNRGPDGARSLMSTIAGSMITVAGISYSIVVVALTLASQQYGPRLLRNFMSARSNQVVLGVFVATFVYCLLVLRSIQETEDYTYVPNVSVSLGVILSLISLGFLIYFIHRFSFSIRAENVIEDVYQEMVRAIDGLQPKHVNDSSEQEKDRLEDLLEQAKADGVSIPSLRTGYIQYIDHETITKHAAVADVLIVLENRTGQFISDCTSLGWIVPGKQLDSDLARSIVGSILVGPQRTPHQDLEYAIHQLVEVSVRALSKGINDPFTAIACVDRLNAGLSRLNRYSLPAGRFYKEDKLRLALPTYTYDGIVDSAFAQLRQNSEGIPALLIRMQEALEAIAHSTDDPERLQALQRHAAMIHRSAERSFQEEEDLADARESYNKTLKATAFADSDSSAQAECG